jgi:HEAT repeats
VSDRQLDLFSGAGYGAEVTAAAGRPRVAAVELDDESLVAAIPSASLHNYRTLAAEAGRRRLVDAVPALEALCRRFRGFGLDRAIPEQIAALQALAVIGGCEAANAAERLITGRVVQGPGLDDALATAGRLGVGLPDAIAVPLLRDAAPRIRAGACRCARPSPAVIRVLIELLGDTDRGVVEEGACALGRMGRSEARPTLSQLLREAPSPAVVDAVAAVADDECLVLIGRLARTRPEMADAALAALDDFGTPRAATIAAAARRSMPS